MSEIYKGRGNSVNREEYLDFINYVFGFNGTKDDFEKLLPKLYKPEYSPCENNYVVTEDEKLKAAIGVYPRELDVLGIKLRLHGVGNVAVHPRARSKGYMRELLDRAIKDMIASGADMSDLGGLRQRYGYFSYECASAVCRATITPTSLRHCFCDPPKPLAFSEVKEDDEEILDLIAALHSKKLLHMIRPREAFLDIARSWNRRLYAIHDGERFVGYFIDSLIELTLADMNDFDDVVRNYVAAHGKVTLTIPLCETKMLGAAWRICDDAGYSNDQNYTVFHWKKVVNAFMKLKATYSELADGERSYLVHGIAGDESFTIKVKDGKLTFSDVTGDGIIELEHKDAVSYFLGLVSPERMSDGVAMSWFPLPLFVDSADHV